MNDFSNLKFNLPEISYPKIDFDAINRQQQAALDSIQAANEERAAHEKEKREALKRIADNSEDTVNSLKETNELLRENNRLLRNENERLSESLTGIQNILSRLFDLEQETGDDQTELLRQATALAVQIDMSINENGKFNWKDFIGNTTSSGLILALQVYLHSKGIL